jgi:protein phosphatase 1L
VPALTCIYREDEVKRITDLGGRVIFWGRWRVEGVLAVSRGIGDAKLKPYVTSEPEVTEKDLEEQDLFLVIASDGLWDVMQNEEVARIVMR